jgi:hypothetical protein
MNYAKLYLSFWPRGRVEAALIAGQQTELPRYPTGVDSSFKGHLGLLFTAALDVTTLLISFVKSPPDPSDEP